MKFSYNWLQNYFKEKLPSPEEVAEGIIFHSFEVDEIEKVGDDTIFDIKILPDRAHDCLSHWGVAKEIGAIFSLEIFSPNGFFQVLGSPSSASQTRPDHSKSHIGSELEIKIEDKKCLRYMGRIVRNIKIGESPEWLQKKLNAIGQKSINNIVDATNFVMFDLGQPIHAFDLDKLASEKIIIRNGKMGEKITTLDKKNIDLDESMLVITDEKEPLAIAGIKGGNKAEVDVNTKNIIIEVANFEAISTRRTAKKINILTDAVKRYENEISPELCEIVIKAITDLIYNLAGGEIEEIVDIYPQKQEQKNIIISVDYINKRLGTSFTKSEIESVWKKLNFEYIEKQDEFEIKIPFLRIDLIGPHDLTEEVVRILGYEKIEEKIPEVKYEKEINKNYFQTLSVREKLLNEGYSEVMTYAFRDKGEVEVLASASDKKFLRTNLTDGLKESLKLNQLNLPFLEMKEIKIFEIGTIFKKDSEEIHVAYGDKKEIKEMSLEDFCKNAEPNAFVTSEAPYVFSEWSGRAKGEEDRGPEEKIYGAENKFKMWSVYPFISRDVAVWLGEGEDPEKLKQILIKNGTELLVKEPYLFDSFTKEGKTSYAFRLIFQSYDRTLTDEEINPIMVKIKQEIEKKGWQIR